MTTVKKKMQEKKIFGKPLKAKTLYITSGSAIALAGRRILYTGIKTCEKALTAP
jgi:hypothetical protein